MSPRSLLDSNLAALGHQPGLVDSLVQASRPDADVWTAADGGITGRIGSTVLHHAEAPIRDARRWAAGALEQLRSLETNRATIIGFGLGHHVEALREIFDGTIVVVEPDVGLLGLAFSLRDLSALLPRIEIQPGTSPTGTAGSCILPYAPLRLLEGGKYAEAARNCAADSARGVGPLRILVVTPMLGGSHPIALHTHRALRRLGHEAELLDLSTFLPSYQQLGQFGARASRLRATESLFCDTLGDGVAARVEEGGFDLVLALAQAPLGPRALETIRSAGALTAFWFVEDRKVFPYWREVVAHYDHVFTIQKGESIADMREAGARHVEYLPCAAAIDIHRPLGLSAQEARSFGSDVSFVGAGYRNRREAFRRFLDLDFRIWGSDWDGAAELQDVLQRNGSRVSTEDSVRIWNSTKVNLNLHSSTYCNDVDPRGDFVNPRTFEIAACGAFQVVDRRTLLSECFELGREVIAVDRCSEMKDATRYYLDRPGDRAAIAEAGRQRVASEHTYERRMETLIASVVSANVKRFARRRRVPSVGDARRTASKLLTSYLENFADDRPFSLQEMVGRIPNAEGPLTDAEGLFLYLSQFDDLYLSRHRQ